MQTKLYIIDAMAMAFRHFYAFGKNQLTNSQGLPTSAIYGSANFIHKLLEEAQEPCSIIIATDSKSPTFRHELYNDYKANRGEMPEELAAQIPSLYRLFEAMGLPLLQCDGVEADDLIGSVVKQAPTEVEKYIVSGDKDFMQLLDQNTYLYTPKKGGEYLITKAADVTNKYGVQPEQTIDILAIWGDSADNVPGVFGIGEKGAAKLIQEYGSLEAIYEQLEEVKSPRTREKLSESKANALLSKQLVTIKTDLALSLPMTQLLTPTVFTEACCQRLHDFYREMEFRRLSEKVQAGTQELVTNKTQDIHEQDKNYTTITTTAQWIELLKALKASTIFAIDTETTGLDICADKPIGISLSIQDDQAWYVPLHDTELKLEQICDDLNGILQTGAQTKVGHNLKFDMQMLHNIGIYMTGPLFDTMLAAYLLAPNDNAYSLDHCCLHWLNYRKIPTTDLMGKDKATSMQDVPLEELSRYACEDADLTLQLYQKLSAEIDKAQLQQVFYEIEAPLVPVLAQMEASGVHVNTEFLGNLSEQIGQRLEQLKQDIFTQAGESFNINSPKQLQAIIYDKLAIHEELKVKNIKKTKTGYSTDVTVLERLKSHPLIESLLEFRSLSKILNTYTSVLPQLVNPHSHRIHTNFHQTGTATGRLSSSKPNLQNIPIRSSLGQEIRKAFNTQNPQHLILAADYSQVELRLLAHLANEQNLIAAFDQDADIHQATAAKIFGTEPEAVTSAQRAQAKSINFGLIYGMGPQRLARQTGVSTAEAKQFISQYFSAYPQIKVYLESLKALAQEQGYVTTMMGRKRPIPEINSTNSLAAANAANMAVNTPIQGSAADLIKLAMIKIKNQLDQLPLRAKMLLQVHDELVFECHKDDLSQLMTIVRDCMENAFTLKVPLKVDMGQGKNWFEAH